jgi:hypothetical protein
MRSIRIGSGAGFSGDRIEPAVELAARGGIQYLGFECLAERTIALAQAERLSDADAGFDPLLVARFEAVLPACRANGVRIITNMGAANPASAARKVAEVARRLGMTGLRVAAVTGDDVLNLVRQRPTQALLERSGSVADLSHNLISANAYLGVDGIVQALANDFKCEPRAIYRARTSIGYLTLTDVAVAVSQGYLQVFWPRPPTTARDSDSVWPSLCKPNSREVCCHIWLQVGRWVE